MKSTTTKYKTEDSTKPTNGFYFKIIIFTTYYVYKI